MTTGTANCHKLVHLWVLWGMARAGKALRRILETYGISQTRLAIEMRIPSSNVNRWVNESRDPSAEAVAEIREALEKIEPGAAEEFVRLYLYNMERN